MPVATSTQAGREVLTPEAEKILNDREKRRQAHLRAAAARADTLTPLGDTKPAFELETLPEPPAVEPDLTVEPRTLVMSITILYRGRQITISSSGRTLDQFCDLLDKRLGAPS